MRSFFSLFLSLSPSRFSLNHFCFNRFYLNIHRRTTRTPKWNKNKRNVIKTSTATTKFASASTTIRVQCSREKRDRTCAYIYCTVHGLPTWCSSVFLHVAMPHRGCVVAVVYRRITCTWLASAPQTIAWYIVVFIFRSLSVSLSVSLPFSLSRQIYLGKLVILFRFSVNAGNFFILFFSLLSPLFAFGFSLSLSGSHSLARSLLFPSLSASVCYFRVLIVRYFIFVFFSLLFIYYSFIANVVGAAAAVPSSLYPTNAQRLSM